MPRAPVMSSSFAVNVESIANMFRRTQLGGGRMVLRRLPHASLAAFQFRQAALGFLKPIGGSFSRLFCLLQFPRGRRFRSLLCLLGAFLLLFRFFFFALAF